MSVSFDFKPFHHGLAVRDLDAAMRFWVDGLGFEVGPKYDIDKPIAGTSGDVRIVAQFIQKGERLLELLYFISPAAPELPMTERPALGFTHMGFLVDDVLASADWLVQHGGTIIEGSHKVYPPEVNDAEVISVQDQDGTRVEIMRIPSGGIS